MGFSAMFVAELVRVQAIPGGARNSHEFRYQLSQLPTAFELFVAHQRKHEDRHDSDKNRIRTAWQTFSQLSKHMTRPCSIVNLTAQWSNKNNGPLAG